ncbi:hypothetical protein Taro_026116 [Colocasia esculenta]|uniref:Retrotransposon gag domain-containing protein n=1 Tax=Colocasia esculenta TaxID=4460 RepID=A0A843VEA4_COLES|nr:hypothetical protein [Colocasia esculenta]
MADRRDWGGGGNDPEEGTQRMIERIWESLTDIRARMDQQAPVPPVAVPPGDGEAVPVAPVPPRVEVPFAAPVPPPPPVLIAEEPVMQVEKFLRLQPPTYLGGPNPDTAEHWVHEIERVFATMRCPEADRVVLAAYQLRGFALEWWRLKMQTTFAGRTEEAITWPEFLDVFNDTFFPIQVQQVKREQFRTLQQGTEEWLDDRRTRGVAELREETSRRGAILVGARGEFNVNWEIAGGSSDAEASWSSSQRRPVSPSSHCLTLRWFWSHVGRSGVRPQLGQAAVVCEFLWCSVVALSHSSGEADAGARLASRERGRRVPFLASSGGGLVAVIVTTFPPDVSTCYPLPLPARQLLPGCA